MTNICYVWFVLSHSLPGGGISCAVSGVYFNKVVFFLKYVHFFVFILEEVRSVHLAAITEDRVVWESRIIVDKLCVLSCMLKTLLCLRSEVVDHDLHPGHVCHKMLNVLNIRN